MTCSSLGSDWELRILNTHTDTDLRLPTSEASEELADLGRTLQRGSQTPAGLHHHVAVFLEDDVVVVVVEEDGDRAELGGGAARLRDLVGLQEVDLYSGGTSRNL